MYKINSNIFLVESGEIGLKECPKCKKLMGWDGKNWYCDE
jgi:hypothetical protein